MSLSPGTRLGHYNVTALIGEGGGLRRSLLIGQPPEIVGVSPADTLEP